MLRFSSPSKVFLCGEYNVLFGGKALAFNLAPRFYLDLNIESQQISGSNPFPDGSPAGIYWQQNQNDFAGLQWRFHDPHIGRGGLGASSAQFLLLKMAHEYLQALKLDQEWMNEPLLAWKRWEDYKAIGSQGSGADVLSQSLGGLVEIDPALKTAQAFAWPFKDLGLLIYRTGMKVTTHSHLDEFRQSLDAVRDRSQELTEASNRVFKALRQSDTNHFLAANRDYSLLLKELGLLHPVVKAQIEFFKSEEGVFARGCGALGADVVAVLYRKPLWTETSVNQLIAPLRWEFLGSEHSISEGARLEEVQRFRHSENKQLLPGGINV